VTTPGPATSNRRPTIEERAERRERVESGGSDRYTSLVRALRAGKEVPLREREAQSLEWHPVAGKLLIAAVVGVLAYLAIVTGYNAWRDSRVETWSGPDATVMSGQRLADCPVANALHDDVFPTWVRYGGRVFIASGSMRPVGNAPTPDYPMTPYQLGDLRLHTIANTPDGRAGNIILLRLADGTAGQVFELNPDCR
jgi:hypothetical protein